MSTDDPAIAKSTSIDRRTALGAILALGIPSASLAIDATSPRGGLDGDSKVNACAGRVVSLFNATDEISARVDTVWEECISRRPKDLLVSQNDRKWGCSARVGSVIPPDDIKLARLTVEIGRRNLADGLEVHPPLKAQWERLEAIDRAAMAWEADRMSIERARKSHDDALDEMNEAQEKLLASKPKTLAGLRTLVRTLLETGGFDIIEAEDFARALLNAPVLSADGR